jgi:hypothetical protein
MLRIMGEAVEDLKRVSREAPQDEGPLLYWVADQLEKGGAVHLSADPITGIVRCTITFRPSKGEEVEVFGQAFNVGGAIVAAREALAAIVQELGRGAAS